MAEIARKDSADTTVARPANGSDTGSTNVPRSHSYTFSNVGRPSGAADTNVGRPGDFGATGIPKP